MEQQDSSLALVVSLEPVWGMSRIWPQKGWTMASRGYRKLLIQADRESFSTSSIENRRGAGVDHLARVREVYGQVSEARERQILQWRLLKEAWKEPFRPAQEPLRDEAKALKRAHWHLGAFLLTVVELAFAYWFVSTYHEVPVPSAAPHLRALALAAPGVLLAAAVSLLFHDLMAVHDDEKRPKRAYRRFSGIATLSSLTGLAAIVAFHLTRHLLTGGPSLLAGLGIPTVGLASGVTASLRCAVILHRPNRLAALYAASSRLLMRLEPLLEQVENQADREGDALGGAGLAQGPPGAGERYGGDRAARPELGAPPQAARQEKGDLRRDS